MQALLPVLSSDVEENTIQHFSLETVLPEGHVLAVNTASGVVSLISDGPRLVVQQSFSQSEITIVLPLIASFPYHAPYEMLYASFHKGNTLERTIERARKHLDEALSEGQWDAEMKPLRNNLSRARFKLRYFGMDVKSILETGYILQIARKRAD